MSGWLASLKLAWNDLVAERRRSLFFALLVAVGVASLVGVQGVARSIETGTHESARQLMQADLKVTPQGKVSAAQLQALDDLKARGAQVTMVVNGMDVAVNPASKAQAMVSVKAVDPKLWPFYGGFATTPDRPLADLLSGQDRAVVAPGLLVRLGLKVGDTFQMGGRTVTIAGVIDQEPQTIGENVGMGPRVLVSTEWLKGAPRMAPPTSSDSPIR